MAGQTKRGIVLGADSWAVLIAAAKGVPVTPPLRAADGPALTPEQAAAAEVALRGSALVVGASGDLVADLHPSLHTSLAIHADPAVVIDAWAGLGRDLTTARYALAAPLASSFRRTVAAPRPLEAPGADPDAAALEYGPVTWSTMLCDELTGAIVDQLGAGGEPVGDAPPRGELLALEPALAAAITRALADQQPELASMLAGGVIPRPLRDAARGLERTARIDISSRAGRTTLFALETGGGWWTATLDGGDLQLAPASRGSLKTDLAGLLAGALQAPVAA